MCIGVEIRVHNDEGEFSYVAADGREFEQSDFSGATFYADAKLQDKVDVVWGGDRLHVMLKSPFGTIEEAVPLDNIGTCIYALWEVDPRQEKLARLEDIDWDVLPDSILDTIYSLYTTNRRDLNGIDSDAE